MSNLKKVIITLPEELLEQADSFSQKEGVSRSAMIREALSDYIKERKREQIREQMEEGYAAMGSLNLALAEEWMVAEERTLIDYEKALKE